MKEKEISTSSFHFKLRNGILFNLLGAVGVTIQSWNNLSPHVPWRPRVLPESNPSKNPGQMSLWSLDTIALQKKHYSWAEARQSTPELIQLQVPKMRPPISKTFRMA